MAMTERDAHYAWLLHLGPVVVRDAIKSGDHAWAEAEAEMLHNVPSLIGETNEHRRRNFIEKEAPSCIDWVAKHGPELAQSRARSRYAPIFEKLKDELCKSDAAVAHG